MKTKIIALVILSAAFCSSTKAQTNKADSAAVAKVLHELLLICRSVDFTDPRVSELGMFYKAAPYIIYRGEDKKRKWKDFTNYALPEDKKGVDNVCERINQTANQDSTGYKIIKFHTEKESEGTWYVLQVRYKRKGVEKTSAYAFLKIRNKFGLGDID